ncbi:hypothetical protein LCGC14_3000870 [marine sediment metagenome]|uniref:Uncharacterized protein n=1 Tax=marine sediment metagenome TaxID=412755 RepID=A0A0F8Z8N6_9ZZZZ
MTETINPDEGQPQEGDPKYEELKTELEERDVEFDEQESSKSLAEEEESTEHKTDLQAVLNALIPKLPTQRMRDLLLPALVSRVFPDNYTDKHFLLAASQIEELDPAGDVDVIAIISITQDILSKAFEGRHIIDLLELAGVAHEEEMDKLAKDLGLS